MIGEKGKTILLAIKSLGMFIFHQKDTVHFLAGKGVAIGSIYIVATTELTAKLTNECKVHTYSIDFIYFTVPSRRIKEVCIGR